MQRFRSARREKDAMRKLAASPSSGGVNPLLDLIREERKREVLVALSRLEPSDQELLRMSFGEELSSEEIGRKLGINAGAVRVRRHRALRRLSEVLGVTRAAQREAKG
jgi:RNA polymerase sigma factor (sigma-70 family)